MTLTGGMIIALVATVCVLGQVLMSMRRMRRLREQDAASRSPENASAGIRPGPTFDTPRGEVLSTEDVAKIIDFAPWDGIVEINGVLVRMSWALVHIVRLFESHELLRAKLVSANRMLEAGMVILGEAKDKADGQG